MGWGWGGQGKSKNIIMNQQAAFPRMLSYAFVTNTLPLARSLAVVPWDGRALLCRDGRVDE